MRDLLATKIKANAKYTCQECGATELIQAHHETPGDDSTLVALCADCHCRKHPDVPRALFFSKRLQPYWQNKSAASLARELGVSSRTIIRVARQFEIPQGELSPPDEELIKKNIPKLNPKVKASRAIFLLPKQAASYLGITIQDFYSLLRQVDIPSSRFKRKRGNREYFVEYFQKEILKWHLVFDTAKFYLEDKMSEAQGAGS